jgi:class 3 adenylate cyclase
MSHKKKPFYDIEMKERYLAIVLLDIIGSTAFVQRVGARNAAQWFQVHDRLARSLCYRFNGREIDRSDGFLLSFETVVDAVNFALRYQKTIPPKIKLQTRIGIHWGKIIEVKQDDLFVGVGAKRVELEGLAKNIAARTMSLCQAGQVLLTKEAMQVVKHRVNAHTPKSTRYVCVGMYKFKGVREPQEVYAVGESIESLQPPPGSDKVKRLGGPKYIKSRVRDRKLKEWFWYFYWRLAIIAVIFWAYILIPMVFSPTGRYLLGLPYSMPWLDAFGDFFMYFIEIIREAFEAVKKDIIR